VSPTVVSPTTVLLATVPVEFEFDSVDATFLPSVQDDTSASAARIMIEVGRIAADTTVRLPQGGIVMRR
jgi:hypothetical protein